MQDCLPGIQAVLLSEKLEVSNQIERFRRLHPGSALELGCEIDWLDNRGFIRWPQILFGKQEICSNQGPGSGVTKVIASHLQITADSHYNLDSACGI